VAILYLLVGLGNPGSKYQLTRHNAGFLVIDHIAQKWGLNMDRHEFSCVYGKGRVSGKDILLAKPQTFMNLSGRAVFSLVSFFKLNPDQMLVIYDDLDLPLGTIRIKLSGSSGGHRGLASILGILGTKQIPRLRIGIGKPDGEPAVDYVLTPFPEDEKPLFQRVIETSAEAGISYVTQSPEYAMNHFNRLVEAKNPATSDNLTNNL
jgi:PTH1 family peptidyl-tRNA hydrolase